MSGHSKWHKVKHRKAATDSKRSKSFARLSREIKVAARAGKDPATNASLRDAIERARQANVPQANIDRLLSDQTDNQQSVIYEGYGAGGVAILVSAETDNTNRTVSELRTLFKKHGGRLGEPGSVRWKFSETVTIEATLPPGANLDTVELALIDAGAADINRTTEDTLSITGPIAARPLLENTLQERAISLTSSFLTHTVPANQRLTLSSSQHQNYASLIRELEDRADVIDVATDAAVE